MKLVAICPCFYPDTQPIWRLVESAAFFGIDLRPFGVGKPWKGTVGGDTDAHFTEAPQIIRNIDADLILFVDGCDTLFCQDTEAIIAAYQTINDGDIVLSAEKDIYPPRLYEEYQQYRHADPSRYDDSCGLAQYPNGGGWIGPPDQLLSILEHMRENYRESMEAQYRWIKCYLHGGFNMKLDSDFRLFNTISGGGGKWLAATPRGVVNTETETYPSILHWNGRMGGIDEWRENLKKIWPQYPSRT